MSALDEARHKYKSGMADIESKCKSQVSEAQNRVIAFIIVLRNGY